MFKFDEKTKKILFLLGFIIVIIIVIILVILLATKKCTCEGMNAPEEIKCDKGDDIEKRICTAHPDIYKTLINIYAPGVVPLRDKTKREAATIVISTIGKNRAKDWMDELRADPELTQLINEIDTIEVKYMLGEKEPPKPAEGFTYYYQ